MSGVLTYACAVAILSALALRRLQPQTMPMSIFVIVAGAGMGLVLCVGESDTKIGLLTAVLVVCTITDTLAGYIFDDVTAVAGATLVACAVAANGVEAMVLGAAAGAAPFLTLYLLTNGRGMGLGDAKLGAVLGAGLGYASALESIGIAFCVGALFGVTMLACGRLKRTSALPFAPFLALGAALTPLVAKVASWPIG